MLITAPKLPIPQASEDFKRQLEGYGMTTVDIEYFNPDAPWLINANTYTWQFYDISPLFPKLMGFLDFWQRDLDGKLRSVRVAHERLIKPVELRVQNGQFRLH